MNLIKVNVEGNGVVWINPLHVVAVAEHKGADGCGAVLTLSTHRDLDMMPVHQAACDLVDLIDHELRKQ